MTPGQTNPPIPASVSAKYAAWTWVVASQHPPHSTIHRLTNSLSETRFLKVTRLGWTPSADAEARRLRWARPYAPVPEVLEAGVDDRSTWLITGALTGRDATHSSFRTDARRLVTVLAHGLREFHRISAKGCPFQFRIADALQVAHDRLKAGHIDAERDFHAEHAHLSSEQAVEKLLRTRPDTEDLVVCHGDYCLPNVLIDQERVVGYVDLGELGVADRWWDVAVASWSITWNLGPGLEEHFFAAYGIEPDLERISFYRLLYDVVS